MLYYTRFHSPLWEIILAGDAQGITHAHMVTEEGKRTFLIEESWVQNDVFFAEAKQQILEYLDKKRTAFTLSLNPQGTTFQKKVWTALCSIPYGETRTYKDIAIAIGNAKAARAIGMANSLNPIPLIIPCHRVVGSGGALTGFAHGLTAKKTLLDLEKKAE